MSSEPRETQHFAGRSALERGRTAGEHVDGSVLVGAAYRSGSGCAPNGDVDYDAAVFEIELGTVPTDLFPQLRPGSVLLALLVTSAAAAGVVTESLGQQSPSGLTSDLRRELEPRT
ncbi:MAG: hypothetical protein M3186_17245 [Actinomycetota bacterium]|nr:hypothetical protein [Actinomycetota bacterium]